MDKKSADYCTERDVTAPAKSSKWVTPSNDTEIYPGEFSRELLVKDAGVVVYRCADGTEDWDEATEAGGYRITVQMSHVLESGTPGGPADGQTTTATLIKAYR